VSARTAAPPPAPTTMTSRILLLPSPHPAAVLEISQELVPAVRYALVTGKLPCDGLTSQRPGHRIKHSCLRETEKSNNRREHAGQWLQRFRTIHDLEDRGFLGKR